MGNRYFLHSALIGLSLLCLAQGSAAAGKVRKDTLRTEVSGRQITVRVSYPITEAADRIVLWTRDRTSTSFVSGMSRENLLLRPSIRNSLLAEGIICAEYIDETGTVDYGKCHFADDDPLTGAADMKAVADCLKKQPNLAGKKVIVLGFGDECMTDVLFATAHQGNVQGLVLVSPRVDNTLSTIGAERKNALLNSHIEYLSATRQAHLDSLNAASSLDSEYGADVLSRLLYDRQHVEPLEGVAATCTKPGQVYAQVEKSLTADWQKEDENTRDFWKNDVAQYVKFFTSELTPCRTRFLITNWPQLYGRLTCPMLVLFGKNDTEMDWAHNKALLEQVQPKQTLTVIDGADHEMKDNVSFFKGRASSDAYMTIARWCGTAFAKKPGK